LGNWVVSSRIISFWQKPVFWTKLGRKKNSGVYGKGEKREMGVKN